MLRGAARPHKPTQVLDAYPADVDLPTALEKSTRSREIEQAHQLKVPR
jgi:hypothetical protein